VSVDHYENFPVASWLCPPALRPAVVALYRFARTADDLADEGDAAPAQRLSVLGAYRQALDAAVRGAPHDGRWPDVFAPLAAAIARFGWPPRLLHDLLDAFEQDVVKDRYADRHELLDYCRRSANPIGRLLLHLYGVRDAQSLAQSDAICSALQLANFWQDLGVDTRRGRLYVPLVDACRHGVDPAVLLAGTDAAAAHALVAELAAWTRSTMHDGTPLVHRLPGRAGLELRLVVQGGLRILDKIDRLRGRTLTTRPVLRWTDAPVVLARAAGMRAVAAPMAGERT
jgi:squalene synthase HpnC